MPGASVDDFAGKRPFGLRADRHEPGGREELAGFERLKA